MPRIQLRSTAKGFKKGAESWNWKKNPPKKIQKMEPETAPLNKKQGETLFVGTIPFWGCSPWFFFPARKTLGCSTCFLDLQLPNCGFLLWIPGEFLHTNPELPPMLGDRTHLLRGWSKTVTSLLLIQPNNSNPIGIHVWYIYIYTYIYHKC